MSLSQDDEPERETGLATPERAADPAEDSVGSGGAVDPVDRSLTHDVDAVERGRPERAFNIGASFGDPRDRGRGDLRAPESPVDKLRLAVARFRPASVDGAPGRCWCRHRAGDDDSRRPCPAPAADRAPPRRGGAAAPGPGSKPPAGGDQTLTGADGARVCHCRAWLTNGTRWGVCRSSCVWAKGAPGEGDQPLGLDAPGDGVLYVPEPAEPGVPLLIFLHGAMGAGHAHLRAVLAAVDRYGVILVAPRLTRADLGPHRRAPLRPRRHLPRQGARRSRR